MTEEVLEKSGYKKYEIDLLHKHASCLYQKRVIDEKGTKYFINAYGYGIYETSLSFDYEVHLQRKGYCVDMTIFNTNTMTIEEIESEIDNLWYGGGFEYYENWFSV